MLTARDGETDLLVGLAVGADDYMTKPFSMRELDRPRARAAAAGRAVGRRRRRSRSCGSATSSSTPRRAGCASTASSCTSRRSSSTSSTTSRRVPVGSRRREELLAQVWGYDVPSGARTVDSHIRTIRRKLGADDRAHRARRRLRGRGGARVHVKRPRTPERPLDPLPTLKLKISVIILAAVAVTVGVFFVGLKVGLWPSVAGVLVGARRARASCGSSPAASPRRCGRWSPRPRRWPAATSPRRVTAISHDEIGTLARAFNQMAAELAETDRLRRDLVANVSHELRTPITALQAVLENLVDGVGRARSRDAAHDARAGRTARPARAAAARPLPARVGHAAARPQPRSRSRR